MRILYACNDLDYWRAHRLGLAGRMIDAGHQVALICGQEPDDPAEPAATDALGVPGSDRDPALWGRDGAAGDHTAGFAAAGSRQAETAAGGPFRAGGDAAPTVSRRMAPLRRQRLDPLRDLAFGRAIAAAAAEFDADAVHLITLKPVLFGGAALRWAGSRARVVATFAGLGRVFGRPGLRQRLVTRGLRHSLSGDRCVAVFENPADRDRLVAAGVVPSGRTAIVHGAGFDRADFPPLDLPPGPTEGAPLRILFAARLLRAKGLPAVLDAAALLQAQGAPVAISVAGWGGDDPDAVPEAVLRDHAERGLIRFCGRVPADGMAALIGAHHVLALPTLYPEGTPRILAEAGAVGRCAIVSDNPGCTAFVRDGIEGTVLARVNGPAIADAAVALLRHPDRLRAMGAAARRRALEDGFTLDAVAGDYERLYRDS